jgi:hypothetical protein
MLRRIPKFRPEAMIIMLFGPGVILAESAKMTMPKLSSVIIISTSSIVC